MFVDVVLCALSLALILFSCFLFTNAVEWFGKRLGLGHGMVGSIFAAVGTALPETVIPIIAIVFYGDASSKEVGVGAIAGAPFMLGTLAFFVTGAAVIVYTLLGKRGFKMNTDVKVISKDLTFFLCVYGAAVLTTFVRQIAAVRYLVAIGLVLSYIVYLKISYVKDDAPGDQLDPLVLTQLFKAPASMFWIVLQMLLALCGIVFGADLFVQYVGNMSERLGVLPLVLSIIITPIATELPEKFNSVIWTGKKKDTLALGNITGSMVFQSCFPVAFGVAFTAWDLTGVTLVSAVIALAAAAFNLAWIKIHKALNPFVMLLSGGLYAALMVYIFR